MADLIDSAAGELQQAGGQLSRAGVRAGVKIAAGTTRISVRMVGSTIHALIALLDAARQASRSRSQEGELNLRQFTRVTDGKREVVPIKDADVARQLTRELRRHGVTFAVEKNTDGTRTFHVQGKDSSLIEHALTSAAIKVDEKITRDVERPGAEQGMTSMPEPGMRVLKINDEQKATLVEALRESAQGAEKNEAGTLADQVDDAGEVTLNEQNVHTLGSVLTEKQDLPEDLADIAAVVDEEKAAIAVAGPAGEGIAVDQSREVQAEPGVGNARVTLELDDHERGALSSQLQGPAVNERVEAVDVDGPEGPIVRAQLVERIETTGQIDLTPQSVEQLHEVFTNRGWTPGAEGDQAPEHLRWIVSAISDERQSHETHAVGPRSADPEALAEPRDTTPRLVEHGAAPYQNRAGARQSYFAVIDQGGTHQTVWGVDLERAIAVGGAQLGDKINLENIGSIPVTLPDGTEAHRNTWNVTVADSASTQREISHTPQAVIAPQETQNPYLRDDLPAQDMPAELTSPDPVTAERSVPVAGERTSVQKSAVNRRDATRERVARRVDVKVAGMRQEGAGAPPVKAQVHDASRNPTVRR